MLQQQLHPLIAAAAAASRDTSTCVIRTDRFEAAVTTAAHQLNDAFLQTAWHAQQLLKAQQATASSRPPSSSAQQDNSLSSSSTDRFSTDRSESATKRSSVSGNTTEPVNDAAAAAAGWDGDDGSTAVFAMLVGRQLFVGNVGNSRAILCTSQTGNSSRTGKQPQEYSHDALAGTLSNVLPRCGVQRQGITAGVAHYSKAVKTTALALYEAAAKVAAGVSNNNSDNAVQNQQGQSAVDRKHVYDATGLHEAAVNHPVQRFSSSCRNNEHYNHCHSASSSRYGSDGASRPLRPVDAPSEPLNPVPLSSDHTPERDAESARIRSAGGQVYVNPATPNGKLRVRGELEVTRSFGDLGFQDQGVVATPEFKSLDLQPGDAFVVLASDGVFEVLSQDDVCQQAWGLWSGSSSVATALPPPPALALSGQVAAASTQQQQQQLEAGTESSGVPSTVPGNSAGVLRGCCDCTIQQQIQQAAEAAQSDLQVLLRQRRAVRERLSEVALQDQSAHQDATAAVAGEDGTLSCAASAASSTIGGASQTESSGQDVVADHQVTSAVMHGEGQQQQRGADSTCMVTQTSATVEHCQMQSGNDCAGKWHSVCLSFDTTMPVGCSCHLEPVG